MNVFYHAQNRNLEGEIANLKAELEKERKKVKELTEELAKTKLELENERKEKIEIQKKNSFSLKLDENPLRRRLTSNSNDTNTTGIGRNSVSGEICVGINRAYSLPEVVERRGSADINEESERDTPGRKNSIDRISEETIAESRTESRTSSYIIPELKLFGDQEAYMEVLKNKLRLDEKQISMDHHVQRNEIYSRYNIEPTLVSHKPNKRCYSFDKGHKPNRRDSDDFNQKGLDLDEIPGTPMENRKRHPLLGGLNSFNSKPRTSIMNNAASNNEEDVHHLRALGQSIFSIKYKPKLYQVSKLSDDSNREPSFVKSINFDKPDTSDSWNKNLQESVMSFSEQKDICTSPLGPGPLKKASSRISFVPITQPSKMERFKGVIKTNSEEQYLVEELESPVKLPIKPRFKNPKQISIQEEKKIGDNIFEDFFIVGCGTQDFLSLLQAKKKVGNLEAKILATYPNEIENDKCFRRKSVPEFVFPFGCPVERFSYNKPSTKTMLNSLVFSKNQADQREQSFILFMGSEENYKDKNLTNNHVLDKINPERILHLICIKVHDFSYLSVPESQDKDPQKQKAMVWKEEIVYCFMTYYPFVKLFYEILIEILNKIKLKKCEKYAENMEKNPENIFKGVDSSLIFQNFQSDIKKFLIDIYHTKVPNFNDFIEINFSTTQQMTKYRIPATDKIEYEEAKWGAAVTFSNLPFDDFRFLFFSLMMENKIVLLSKSMCLLTSTIITLITLLKPFRWTYPVILSVPEKLMDILHSPVGIIVGINQGKKFLESEKLNINYPDCFFYCLDEESLFCNPNFECEINKSLPKFKLFKEKIKKLYDYFNKCSTNNKLLSNKTKFRRVTTVLTDSIVGAVGISSKKEKKLLFNPTPQEENHTLNIFSAFQDCLRENILRHIPPKPIWKAEASKELDYKKTCNLVLKNNNSRDHNFLTKFCQSQLFFYYLERFYKI